MYTDILQQLGLPKNEAKIYEALVSLGPANVSQISSAAKVNRRNVYDSLKNLLNRGLVIGQEGTKQQVYKAADPKKLLNITDQQKKEINSVLPELDKLYQAKVPKEQAFISRGTEGIKNFWRNALQKKETVYFIAGKGGWHHSFLDEDRETFYKKCEEQGIEIKGIFDYEVRGKANVYSEYKEGLFRFFPKEYSTKASYNICADQVILYPTPDQRVESATIFNIISQPLADSYRTWFEFLWKKAKPLSERNE